MSVITTRDGPRDRPTPKDEATTREESEIKRRILNGEIKMSDLSHQQRDLYREELKRTRRY